MKHDEPVTMCSLESETMYSLEWLRHERRKAWQEGYAAGWKDQECDFPQYKRKPIQGDHRNRKGR